MHPWMYGANDGCLVMGEGTTVKISEFQIGIKPLTSVMPVVNEGAVQEKISCSIGRTLCRPVGSIGGALGLLGRRSWVQQPLLDQHYSGSLNN